MKFKWYKLGILSVFSGTLWAADNISIAFDENNGNSLIRITTNATHWEDTLSNLALNPYKSFQILPGWQTYRQTVGATDDQEVDDFVMVAANEDIIIASDIYGIKINIKNYPASYNKAPLPRTLEIALRKPKADIETLSIKFPHHLTLCCNDGLNISNVEIQQVDTCQIFLSEEEENGKWMADTVDIHAKNYVTWGSGSCKCKTLKINAKDVVFNTNVCVEADNIFISGNTENEDEISTLTLHGNAKLSTKIVDFKNIDCFENNNGILVIKVPGFSVMNVKNYDYNNRTLNRDMAGVVARIPGIESCTGITFGENADTTDWLE